MDNEGIKKTIQLYFDASYESNADKMSRALHPAAHIYGRKADGTLNDMPRDYFVKMVGTPFAEKVSYAREDEIVSIEYTGENTAVAIVKLRVSKTRYTDVLSLIRLDDEWQIIAKLLSGQAVE